MSKTPCACPIDWVACFSKSCPRAALHRASVQKRIEAFNAITRAKESDNRLPISIADHTPIADKVKVGGRHHNVRIKRESDNG